MTDVAQPVAELLDLDQDVTRLVLDAPLAVPHRDGAVHVLHVEAERAARLVRLALALGSQAARRGPLEGEAGVKAVQEAGGAVKGDKTLLDVLIPVTQGVHSQIDAGDPARIGARIVAAAAHGLHGTTHLEAKRGLAAGLGPASINRIDPGACSCALLFGAAVGLLEQAPQAA